MIKKFQLQVEVTEQDIAKGCEYDSNNCPIARAIKRALKGGLKLDPRAVCVDQYEIQIADYRAVTPKKAEAFIDRFNTHQPVKPFAFAVNMVRTSEA